MNAACDDSLFFSWIRVLLCFFGGGGMSVKKTYVPDICIGRLETGDGGEEEDNLWKTAKEEVWHARRLWMGRRVMAWRSQFHHVASRPEQLPKRMLNAIQLLFPGGFQNPGRPLVIIPIIFLPS